MAAAIQRGITRDSVLTSGASASGRQHRKQQRRQDAAGVSARGERQDHAR